MPDSSINALSAEDRAVLAAWVGERPDTVLVIHALASGLGRLWVAGDVAAPVALLVESSLVPGEPQGFGDPDALLGLLEQADGWECVELSAALAEVVEDHFVRKWGAVRRVIDVVHVLLDVAPALSHPLVHSLTAADLATLIVEDEDLLPERQVAERAASGGRMFGAVVGNTLVGHGSSFASGSTHADIGVYVAPAFRGHGLATAAASLSCAVVQQAGLVPVWGTSSKNAASLRVAAKLGFTETSRLVYLVPTATR